MEWCISTAKCFVLVNQASMSFKGLNRRFLFSLFILVMEVLSKIVKKVREEGFHRGFEVDGKGIKGLDSTYLFSAGNTKFFATLTKDVFGFLS